MGAISDPHYSSHVRDPVVSRGPLYLNFPATSLHPASSTHCPARDADVGLFPPSACTHDRNDSARRPPFRSGRSHSFNGGLRWKSGRGGAGESSCGPLSVSSSSPERREVCCTRGA